MPALYTELNLSHVQRMEKPKSVACAIRNIQPMFSPYIIKYNFSLPAFIFLPVFLSTSRRESSSLKRYKIKTQLLVPVYRKHWGIVAPFRAWYREDIPPCRPGLIPLPVGELPRVYLRERWLFGLSVSWPSGKKSTLRFLKRVYMV